MTNIINVEYSFSVATRAEWETTNRVLPEGFLVVVSDENNATKIGNGVDLFSNLPYHGCTAIVKTYSTITLTRVYPASFIIIESDTGRIRFPNGVSQYQALPYVLARNEQFDSTVMINKAAISSAELAAIRTVIDDISTITLNSKSHVTVSAQTLTTAFTNQSLDVSNYDVLSAAVNNGTTSYTIDQHQLLLMMISNLNDRIATIEAALL